MAEISVDISKGSENFPGSTIVQLKLTGYMGNEETGIMLSPTLYTSDEIDYAVACLVKEAEKAGRAAKKILSDSKGGPK